MESHALAHAQAAAAAAPFFFGVGVLSGLLLALAINRWVNR